MWHLCLSCLRRPVLGALDSVSCSGFPLVTAPLRPVRVRFGVRSLPVVWDGRGLEGGLWIESGSEPSGQDQIQPSPAGLRCGTGCSQPYEPRVRGPCPELIPAVKSLAPWSEQFASVPVLGLMHRLCFLHSPVSLLFVRAAYLNVVYLHFYSYMLPLLRYLR